jgi:Tfp pilus assembly protein PilF
MLELEDHPVVRNNLATAFYNGGRLEEAWRIMEPVLAKGAISPFAWALASMIAWDLGWEEAAREYLQKAISLFEGGAHSPRELGFEPAG